MKVTQQQFKQNFGGNLDTLKNKLVLAGTGNPAADITKERKKYQYLEYELQKNVAGFLNLYYPDVKYISNPINLALTKAQRMMSAAIQAKDFKCPDMLILSSKRGYHGLLLELKKESPWKLNGELKSGEHLAGQWKAILHLREQGFLANFYWDLEEIKSTLNWYLG